MPLPMKSAAKHFGGARTAPFAGSPPQTGSDSSHGNAMLTPMPRSSVRRENWGWSVFMINSQHHGDVENIFKYSTTPAVLLHRHFSNSSEYAAGVKLPRPVPLMLGRYLVNTLVQKLRALHDYLHYAVEGIPIPGQSGCHLLQRLPVRRQQ